MRILKITCVLLVLLFQQISLSAQDKLNIKFGKVKPEDFLIQSALIDSSTNAVVVADVGESSFEVNPKGLSFSLVFTEKKRIKIINKNGFDAATVTIPLYVIDNNSEKLDALEAFTYNLENGKVVEMKLEKSAVFTEKHSKHLVYKKFTFPAIKEGSIIEYSYRVKSDFFFNLQPWTFQGVYPVLWSQYETGVPEFFKFVTLAQGRQPFFIDKVKSTEKNFSFVEHVAREGFYTKENSGLNTIQLQGKTDYHTWVMKNVPALREESYITTLDNAVSKIEFQLNQVKFPNSNPVNYMDSWEKVAGDLMYDEEFGATIDRPNNWMDSEMNELVKSVTTQYDKAQKIFEYVRDNFTCNENSGIYVTKNLKDVFKNKSGSVADINMLLIAMLRNQKIVANPVILSTRDHGYTHEYYPLLNRYNYVIAKVETENETFYLDATIRQLGFGLLPTKVYNGQAREITNTTALPIYFIADSLNEAGKTNVYIANVEKGGFEGNFHHDFGTYESLEFRDRMTKTSPDDFRKSLQREYPEEITIANIQIDSLNILTEPVGLKFDLKFKSFPEEDIVYFSPMLSEAIKRNPFAAAERFYPVEMPYTVNELFSLTMEIPKGYKVDELPKSARFNLNEDEGMFEYLISAGKVYVQLQCRLILNKATYLNEDYQTLRDFYTLIVKKEAEQIVFKKIK